MASLKELTLSDIKTPIINSTKSAKQFGLTELDRIVEINNFKRFLEKLSFLEF